MKFRNLAIRKYIKRLIIQIDEAIELGEFKGLPLTFAEYKEIKTYLLKELNTVEKIMKLFDYVDKALKSLNQELDLNLINPKDFIIEQDKLLRLLKLSETLEEFEKRDLEFIEEKQKKAIINEIKELGYAFTL